MGRGFSWAVPLAAAAAGKQKSSAVIEPRGEGSADAAISADLRALMESAHPADIRSLEEAEVRVQGPG